MKKILTVLLSVILIMSAAVMVTACSDPKAKEYTVTYIYDNGQENLTATVAAGDKAVRPRDPEKEGYVFDGWYIDGSGSLYNFDDPVNSDITLKAQYTEKQSGEEEAPKEARLSFREYEYAEYTFDSGVIPRRAKVGDTVKFKLRTSVFYSGTAEVKAGGETVPLGEDGYYSFTVKGDTIITVSGLTRDESPITGLGTAQSPYVISNVSQFKTFSDAVNNVENTRYNTAYIRLDADLDLQGEIIEPIGTTLNDAHFEGVFDGNGHTVSDFTVASDGGIVGFFGYLVQGAVMNLHLADVVFDVECATEQNYIMGGVVAYNMGGDIFGCTFDGKVTVDFSLDTTVAYFGGIAGFVQGYGTDYTATVSYCEVNADIESTGTESMFAVGGIVGAAVGTAESATVVINNCVYGGEITGRHQLVGGIVGYLRNYAAVASCYSSGYGETYSADSLAYAGGIVGLAENETSVAYSYTEMESISDGIVSDVMLEGDAVGGYYKAGFDGIDSRACLIYKTYYAEGGTVSVGSTDYDVTDFADVKSLLGWVDADWTFAAGKPSVNAEGDGATEFTVVFDFGEDITMTSADDNQPLTQSKDNVTVGGVVPVYHVYGGSGLNTFTADSGNISYGYFLDEAHTVRIPSAFVLTQDMTVYVGFASYDDIAGEYFATIVNTDVRLVFDDNGKMTMYADGMVSNRMYVYNGTTILIKDAYFANFLYTTSSGNKIITDYYAEIRSGNTLYMWGMELLAGSSNEVYAYKHNDVLGTWYNADNDEYTFRADGSGYISRYSQSSDAYVVVGTFTYTITADTVTVTRGNTVTGYILAADRRSMTASDGAALAINKFDEFRGDWEGAFIENIFLSFDGHGTVTIGETSYSYTVNEEGKALFEDYTASFDADGLIELTDASTGKTSRLGKAGSFMGTWEETFYDYTVYFYGINKDGYGTGYDSNGVSFTYRADEETSDSGEKFYSIYMYSGTTLYGFGALGGKPNSDSENLKPGEINEGDYILELAVFTPGNSMLLDDYNMCYHDNLEGLWNGADGLSFEFNGLGAYHIDVAGSYGEWRAFGEVTVYDGTEKTAVRYDFDRATGKATFTYKNKTYTAEISENGISVEQGGNTAEYLEPDLFGNYAFFGDGVKLSFNGKSNVGLGKVTVTENDTDTVYDYEIDAGGKAVIKSGGDVVFTAEVVESENKLVLKDAAGGEKAKLGYYSAFAGKTYIGTGDTYITFDESVGLDGTSHATINGIDADLVYVDENNSILYVDGRAQFIIVNQNANNVALYSMAGTLANILSVPDGLKGEYTAANGDKLELDGRSLNFGLYAYATMTSGGEKEIYVYVTDGEGVTEIFLLDRSGAEDRLIKLYTVYTEEVAGGVKFTSESGKSLWLKEVED